MMNRRDFIRTALGVGVTLPLMGREQAFAAGIYANDAAVENFGMGIESLAISSDSAEAVVQTIQISGMNSDGEEVTETVKIPTDGSAIISKTTWNNDFNLTVNFIDQPSYASGTIQVEMRVE